MPEADFYESVRARCRGSVHDGRTRDSCFGGSPTFNGAAVSDQWNGLKVVAARADQGIKCRSRSLGVSRSDPFETTTPTSSINWTHVTQPCGGLGACHLSRLTQLSLSLTRARWQSSGYLAFTRKRCPARRAGPTGKGLAQCEG